MNKAIFITVRTNSTRLPHKCLIKIKGKCAIEYVIERAKKSIESEEIILCTTRLKEDDILVSIAKKNNIEFFRGSVRDKLARWNGAAKRFKVDFFVTADGDDLFCEPELMDLAFRQFIRTKADFIEAKNVPCGAFTYGIKASALKKVCEIKKTTDTEMMWVYFKNTDLFNVERLKGVPEFYQRPGIRMTLDYPEDLRFFSRVIKSLHAKKRYFNLRDIIFFLDKHPQVVKINQKMQDLYLANQKLKTQLII